MELERSIREAPIKARHTVLAFLCAALCFGLFALLIVRGVVKDTSGATTYAALAEAFLRGQLYIDRCPEIDCAMVGGKTYVIFPPLPALLLMPVVAVTGAAGFKGGIWISLILTVVSLAVWWRLLTHSCVSPRVRPWLLAALGFASPLYLTVFMAPGVWFFAQTCAFLFLTLAIYAAVVRNSLFLASCCVALALLCRQMSVFYPLFLYILTLPQNEKMFWPSRHAFQKCLLASMPFLAAVAIMLVYNYARFGNALDTGYAYISNPGVDTAISRRLGEIGVFSWQYFLFNLYHLLFQGLHIAFEKPLEVIPSQVDPWGTAILIASPWLFLMYYMTLDRIAVSGLITIGIIAGITLFYHSNGFEQVNTQRYALDWLPIAFLLLVRQPVTATLNALPPLVTFGVVLNAVAFGTRVTFT